MEYRRILFSSSDRGVKSWDHEVDTYANVIIVAKPDILFNGGDRNL